MGKYFITACILDFEEKVRRKIENWGPHLALRLLLQVEMKGFDCTSSWSLICSKLRMYPHVLCCVVRVLILSLLFNVVMSRDFTWCG